MTPTQIAKADDGHADRAQVLRALIELRDRLYDPTVPLVDAVDRCASVLAAVRRRRSRQEVA